MESDNELDIRRKLFSNDPPDANYMQQVRGRHSPFDAPIAFGAAVEVLEFILDGVFLTHSLLRELHVGRIEGARKSPVLAMITVSTNYD